jgi:hypothetical protein
LANRFYSLNHPNPPWIAPVVEVDNALQFFSAYIRGDQHDYMSDSAFWGKMQEVLGRKNSQWL